MRRRARACEVTEEALENTNVRAPFDGVVIKKRAEVGETVSPFGVAGTGVARRRRDRDDRRSRRARSADRSQREQRRQARRAAMPAEVKLQAYQDQVYRGRLRQIFPSADRAKSIVEVRVTILNPDAPREAGDDRERHVPGTACERGRARAQATERPVRLAPIVLVPKRAVTEQGGRPLVWVVTDRMATRRP